MPVILTSQDEIDTRLAAPAKVAFQRSLPDHALRIVARGERRDEAGDLAVRGTTKLEPTVDPSSDHISREPASLGAVAPERPRKVIHVDMDAFYASVERRDDVELRDDPAAVGGSRKRGVTTAHGPARRFAPRRLDVGESQRVKPLGLGQVLGIGASGTSARPRFAWSSAGTHRHSQ